MIIKSHIRGGYRSAAAYLKTQGKNEKIRTVEISDTDAKNLDEAFRNMWVTASYSKVRKPLHHISINPYKDERLTDAQVLKIVERCEQKYGYKPNDHQCVIIEHIKDGRQHFHVMWNRVSLRTKRPVWPGHHWNKSKQTAREMEMELGLKRPVPRQAKRARACIARARGGIRVPGRYSQLNDVKAPSGLKKTKTAQKANTRTKKPISLVKPSTSTKSWPDAAVLDWELWGHRNPPRFFAKWPELTPEGFTPRAIPPLH